MFEDGSSRTAYLAPDITTEHSVDLMDGWPMAVYEADIPVLNYSGLDDAPYMSPGLEHISDADRMTGWIAFEQGQLVAEPEVEMMRITVSLPKGGDGLPVDADGVVLFDHGTSGHAYNIVQRRSAADDGLALATRYAEAGFAVIGRDAPLYGTRFPLIDEGYGGSLGFYNIVNAPAFRDNQRQTAVDGHTLLRYVQERINDDLPEGSIDTARVRRQGHSLGSVTANLGTAMDPDAYEAVLLSGTGGIFTLYFLNTGLIDEIGPELVSSLFELVQAPVPDEITTPNVLGAVLGVPEPGWAHIDRLHPAVGLFQWQMDPSDPMAVARDEAAPILAVISPGDYQTPDFTADALVESLPDATSVRCNALADYDPHYCMWREQEGFDALEQWLAE